MIGLARGESAQLHPVTSGALVAFYGDSCTRGAKASSEAMRWSTIVCSDLGFVHNRTLFGAGDLRDLIIRQHPDLVIVTLGLNDNFSFSVAAPASADRSPRICAAWSTPCRRPPPRGRAVLVHGCPARVGGDHQ